MLNRSSLIKSETKRLLLISEFFPPRIFGGGERSAFLLAKGLAARGFSVVVLTSRIEGLPERETVEGFEIVRKLRSGSSPHSIINNVRRVALLPFSIRRHVAEMTSGQKFAAILLLNSTSIVPLSTSVTTLAVINGYTPFCPKANLYFKERQVCNGCAPGKFVSCISHSEYVGLSRSPWFLRFNPLFWLGIYTQYLMRRRALAGVDRFVAISGFVAEVLRHHGVGPERIERIYNLAEIEDQGDAPDEEAGAEPREWASLISSGRVATVVGTLARNKGVDLAIRGFALWRSGSDQLLIVGDGPERQNLERLCHSLGVAEQVHFTGRLEPRFLPSIFRRSHAIVLPSQWPEPFSRVAMEAAFYRRPLLASDRGGNRDLAPEHLFSTPEELAEKLDHPPVPSFAPYDPKNNLGQFVRMLDETLLPTVSEGRT